MGITYKHITASAVCAGIILSAVDSSADGTTSAAKAEPSGSVLQLEAPFGYRSTVGLNANTAQFRINDEDYQNGASLGLDARLQLRPVRWLLLDSSIDARFLSFGAFREESTDFMKEYAFTLDARTDLYSSDSFQVYLGFGGEYLDSRENMVFEGTEGYSFRHNLGPRAVLSLESRYLDASLAFSEQFGKKSSSYDIDRSIKLEHMQVLVTSRYSLLSLPLCFDYMQWSTTDYNKDRTNFMFRFMMQPGINANEHLTVFFNYAMTAIPDGEERYRINEYGGGARLIW